VVTGEASSVDDALRLMDVSRPHVVFLDVQLRGETGFDLLARLPPPWPHIIFVTAHDRYAAQAFRVPALDYLLKPVDPAHLAQALMRVRELPVSERRPVAHPAALQSLGLTAREAEVLFWIAQGKSNPQIAAILHNSPETVKKQVQSILGRLGVDSRVNAALRAAEILGLWEN
jgi:DNA-binding NarL/FixJ family response regulator